MLGIEVPGRQFPGALATMPGLNKGGSRIDLCLLTFPRMWDQ